MARTKIDDVLISALGQSREQVYAEIKQLEAQPARLADLQRELAEIELKLKEIDPAIPSKDEEALVLGAEADEKI